MFKLEITTNLTESPEYQTLMKNKEKIFEFFNNAESDLIQLKELIKSDKLNTLFDNQFQTIRVETRDEPFYDDLMFLLDTSQINTYRLFLFTYYLGNDTSLEVREKEKKRNLESVDTTLKNIKRMKEDFDKNAELLLAWEIIEKNFKHTPEIITLPILVNYKHEL